MGVSRIKFASIIGMMSALDEVVKVCGKLGIFHPDNAASFYEKSNKIAPLVSKNPFSELVKVLKDKMEQTNVETRLVDIGNFDISRDEAKEYVSYMSGKLNKILNQKKLIEDKINGYEKSINELGHFVGLDLDLQRIFACKYIKVRFGRLPRESYLKLGSYQDNPYILFFPCTNDEKFYWGVYFSPLENVKEVDKIFSRLSFERLKIKAIDQTPEEKIVNINKLLEEQKLELEEIEKKIQAFWKLQEDQCMRVYTKLKEKEICFTIKSFAYCYKDSFILVGWVPEENEEDLSKTLDDVYGIEYSIERMDDERKNPPPIKLKNNKFSRPFEKFVGMYGLPSYGEVDPTLLVSITYTIIFGIMFGDLGQGIVLAIMGALAWKFKKMPIGKILLRCGISASFFGTIYGSVFGFEHWLDPMYKSLFGLHEKPFEVLEGSTVTSIIYASIGLGVLMVIVSMLVNIYSSIKQKKYVEAILSHNGVVGIIFYSSIIFGAVGPIILGVNVFNALYVTSLIILPVFIMFFKEPLEKLLHKEENWKPEKWGQYIIQNFFEMFEILLSYITNTVSFVRVGAYVLGHAGLMLVVFSIANLLPTPGAIIIIIMGNVGVMLLEGLLVGIQVLRLEFYEIFSRFFEGHGKPFKPVIASRG